MVTYSPAPDFNGQDSFTFKANDGCLDSAPATVFITVQPVNDLPLAASQSKTTDEESPVDITLTASDVDGDSLTFFIVTPPEHGTWSGTPPQLIYTPSRDYAAPDRIVCAANHGTCDSPPSAIATTVRPLIDAPTAAGQTLSTPDDTAP